MIRFSTRQPLLVFCLTAGFGAALWLRILIGGRNVSQSMTAGLVFAGCLLVLTLLIRPRFRLSKRVVLGGLAGGVFLIIPALLIRMLAGQPHPPSGSYLLWAAVVTVVALAEEAFLRGALYQAVLPLAGGKGAVLLGAALFALLHLPLYGLASLPLNLAVGVWLGILRQYSGNWTAPGIAHVTADLAAWFLR